MYLEVSEIDTYYGVFQAIFRVSLHLATGEVACLLGRNGAGKTTTLASIVGLNRPRAGAVRFKGQDITAKRPHQIARLGIGFIPEGRWIFSGLTVRENLELGLRKAGRGGRKAAIEKVYGIFPKLRDMEDQPGGTLSGGEQQMLTIGRTLMGAPELILLDEPTAGLAPLIVQLLGEQIVRLREQGPSILLTEQNAHFAKGISDRAHVIDKGAIVYEGDVERLREDDAMMREYLGV